MLEKYLGVKIVEKNQEEDQASFSENNSQIPGIS